MSLLAAYHAQKEELEDFWGRRQSTPAARRTYVIGGWPVQVATNHPALLAAVDQTAPLYSRAAPSAGPPFQLTMIVCAAPLSPGPPPESLIDRIQYTAYGAVMVMQVGGWGHSQIDYAAHEARVILTPELAGRPDLVSRALLNTIFTNLLQQNGWAMLHATGLRRGNQLLLLLAPHNSGKSTSALRLVMHPHASPGAAAEHSERVKKGGKYFKLFSDSQVYVRADAGRLVFTGFPVGRIKLRADMLAEFPVLRTLLTPELVRNETKYAVDLRVLDPGLVEEAAIYPTRIVLCLLERSGKAQTVCTPAVLAQVEQAIIRNSLHDHRAEVWQGNLAILAEMLAKTELFALAVGTDPHGIWAVVDELMRV